MRSCLFLSLALPFVVAGATACQSSPRPQPKPVVDAPAPDAPAGPGYTLWAAALAGVPPLSLPPIDRNQISSPVDLTDVAAVQSHLALLAEPPECVGGGPLGEPVPSAAIMPLRVGLYIAQELAMAGAPKLAVTQLRQNERAAGALWSCGMSLQALAVVDGIGAERDNVLFALLARRAIEADRVQQYFATTTPPLQRRLEEALDTEQRHVHRTFRDATAGLVLPGLDPAATGRRIDDTFTRWRAAFARGDNIEPAVVLAPPPLAALQKRLATAASLEATRHVLQAMSADERRAADSSKDIVGTLLVDMSLQRVGAALDETRRRRVAHAAVNAVVRRAATEAAVATLLPGGRDAPSAPLKVRAEPFEVRAPGRDGAWHTADDIIFAYVAATDAAVTDAAAPDRRPVCVPLGPDGFALFDKALLAAPDAMTTLSRQARVRPEVQNGVAVGFRFVKIRADSIASQCGLRAGDVVRSVNGRALTSTDDALAAYLELREHGVYDLEVVRARSTITLHYERATRAVLRP